MNILQTLALNSILVTSILTNQVVPVEFDWNIINNHGLKFKDHYNYDDSRALLQLSLMVTNANFSEKPLDAPPTLFQSIAIDYDNCPIERVATRASNSAMNAPANMAYILYNESANVLCIIFTGTSNTCLGILDLQNSQSEIPNMLNFHPGMKAHHGIYTAYQSIRTKLLKTVKSFIETKNPKIIICGHSLGGALSQLCALDLAYYDPLHYSFASPLIFNPLAVQVFDKFVKHSYRVANMSDLVVLSPLPVMPNGDVFSHVGRLIHFQRNHGNYYLNHTLSYVEEYNIPVTIIMEAPPGVL